MSSYYQELLERLSNSLWTIQEFNTMLQQYAESAALKSIALEVTGPVWSKSVYGQVCFLIVLQNHFNHAISAINSKLSDITLLEV